MLGETGADIACFAFMLFPSSYLSSLSLSVSFAFFLNLFSFSILFFFFPSLCCYDLFLVATFLGQDSLKLGKQTNL